MTEQQAVTDNGVYFGRCVDEIEAPETKRGWKRCPNRITVTEQTHRLRIARDRDGNVTQVWAADPATGKEVRCPDHPGAWYRFSTVKGKYSPKKACDSSCRLAVSENCTCSCGGAAHGLGPVNINLRNEQAEKESQ